MVSFTRNPFACKNVLDEKPMRIKEGPLSEIDSELESMNIWKLAKSPNYERHVNKYYPYSELPYTGEYSLLKIPISLQNLIKHVDYWGEGRVVTPHGSSGFSDCYNINQKYKLVTQGGDMDRKIPNRIPVFSDTDCDTSKYIKDKSVELVTISGRPISTSCARDIARIVNNDVGIVVAFGYERESEEIRNLEGILKQENLLYCLHHRLPAVLNELTTFDARIVYVSVDIIKRELILNVSAGKYEMAIKLIKDLEANRHEGSIRSAVSKMIKESHQNILEFTYQLWNNNEHELVKKYLPAQVMHIVNGDSVKIIHQKYNLSLKLGELFDTGESRKAVGDVSGGNDAWKFVPIWEDKELMFKIASVNYKLFLRVGSRKNDERQVYGEQNSNELSYKWTLKPVMYKNNQLFYIISKQFKEGMKLTVDADPGGERDVITDSTPICGADIYGWEVAPVNKS